LACRGWCVRCCLARPFWSTCSTMSCARAESGNWLRGRPSAIMYRALSIAPGSNSCKLFEDQDSVQIQTLQSDYDSMFESSVSLRNQSCSRATPNPRFGRWRQTARRWWKLIRNKYRIGRNEEQLGHHEGPKCCEGKRSEAPGREGRDSGEG
jgi:hypothetical protein